MDFDCFEDRIRKDACAVNRELTSPGEDLVFYESSITPGTRLAMLVQKPAQKGYMLVMTHGWHMSIPDFTPRAVPAGAYLVVHVDMRGRAFSQGKADCNQLELIDVWDAVQTAKKRYGRYLIREDVVYFESGSGGGGNALTLAAKFPDLFSSVTALYPISDYAMFFEQDKTGEFRDELLPWIGYDPAERKVAYQVRSAAFLSGNILSPIFMAHGTADARITVDHARLFSQAMRAAGKENLLWYMELPAVGGSGHLDGVTDRQKQQICLQSEELRRKHRTPVRLPETGTMTVGGYLITRWFRIFLEPLDSVAVVRYDLRQKTLRLICPQGVVPKVVSQLKVECTQGDAL